MPDQTLADVLNRSCHCINVDPGTLQRSLEDRLGDLTDLPGVGPIKGNRYGDALLGVLQTTAS